MDKVLMNCPFCGSAYVSMVYEDFDWSEMHFASFHCGHCGADGPTGVGISKAAAIEDARTGWNRRDQRTCRKIRVPGIDEMRGDMRAWPVCSECGATICANDSYCRRCGARVVEP